MPITWTNSMSVQVKEIDDQHKAFVDMLNSLYTAINSMAAADKLESIIDQLVAYANTHFATEEKYFDQFKYEDTEEHKQAHRDLKAKATEFHAKPSTDHLASAFELADFLENWLVDHLENMDHKYVDCFVKNGLK